MGGPLKPGLGLSGFFETAVLNPVLKRRWPLKAPFALSGDAQQRTLADALKSLKQGVARRLIGQAEHFWQKRYYDFNVRNHEQFVEKLNYIHCNPVKQGLCERPEGWRWSSFLHHATGCEGRIEIEPNGRRANASERREGSVLPSHYPTQAKIGLEWATRRDRSKHDPGTLFGMKKFVSVACALVGAMLGQVVPKKPASSAMKEYSYPSDGFAIKFPYAPQPHADSVHPDFRVWTIHLSEGAAISIRRKVDSEPCDVALEKLKSMAQANNVAIREFSVSGRPAWEEQQRPYGDAVLSERYVCGVGRYYVLTFVWPASGSRPQLGAEIIDSFRLLK